MIIRLKAWLIDYLANCFVPLSDFFFPPTGSFEDPVHCQHFYSSAEREFSVSQSEDTEQNQRQDSYNDGMEITLIGILIDHHRHASALSLSCILCHLSLTHKNAYHIAGLCCLPNSSCLELSCTVSIKHPSSTGRGPTQSNLLPKSAGVQPPTYAE